MKCKLCDEKINKKNNGFSELLDNEEKKRLLKLKKSETVCTECKTTLLLIDVISPY